MLSYVDQLGIVGCSQRIPFTLIALFGLAVPPGRRSVAASRTQTNLIANFA